MKYTFLVDPVPASRPRVPRFGKPYYLPTYEGFRTKMAACVKQIPKTLLAAPLIVDITFFKLIPESFSRRKRDQMEGTYCISNFDLDNLEKAIYDALNEHVYIDDKQVVEHTTRKKWTKENPRIEISIKELHL